MISCDEGKTAVVGMGYKVLSEWATLTYAILMEFKENNKDKEFKEHLKEKMQSYETISLIQLSFRCVKNRF